MDKYLNRPGKYKEDGNVDCLPQEYKYFDTKKETAVTAVSFICLI